MTREESRKRIGNTVRTVMRARRVKVAVVATLLDVSENGVYERLRGDTPFKADELDLLAEFLKIEPAVLFQDADDLLRHASMLRRALAGHAHAAA